MVFAMSFILTWAAFAGIWYVIAYAHGDIEYFERLERYGSDAMINETHIPCVTEVRDFASSFLFSVETQHTIGESLDDLWYHDQELNLYFFSYFSLCRLWQSIHDARVPGGTVHHVRTMHFGCIHSSIYGWHSICQIVTAQEAGSNAALLTQCCYLSSGRCAVSDVPCGRYA